MGIPSYFQDIIRRYPNKIVIDAISQALDELQLDLNCCIHNCAAKVRSEHGYQPKQAALYERRVIAEVIRTIERLVEFTRPRALLYIAIDGPVPLAKMYRQRQRRFRGAETKRRMREQFPDTPPEWDTNQITPGTPFMDALSAAVATALPTIATKHGIRHTAISDSNIPGEGEQKISAYIRTNRVATVPVMRAIYGLDADLIMISLLLDAEEPHSNYFLVRERVVFGSVVLNQEGDTEQCYLWTTALAAHIKAEIPARAARSVIHDYVYIAFLLGNDFLPHIPSMRFRNDGMDRILETLAKIRDPLIDPTSFQPNIPTLVTYLKLLAINETATLQANSSRQEHLIKSFREGQLKFIRDADTPQKRFAAELEQEHLADPACNLALHRVKPDKIARQYQATFATPHPTDIAAISAAFFQMMNWTWAQYHSAPINWRTYYEYASGPLIGDLARYLGDTSPDPTPASDDGWRPTTAFQRTIVLPPISHSLCGVPVNTGEASPHLFPATWPSFTLWSLHGWECEEELPLFLLPAAV